MRISQGLLALAATSLLLTACGDEKPAANAVAQAENAITPLRDDATKYAPEELKAADSTLARMKDNLAKEEYKNVVADVPKINNDIKALQGAVVQKQTLAAAAQNEWDALNADVPKAIEAIQVRVDSLKGQKLPKEITKENYEAAKTDLESIKTTWTEATAAATAGNTQEAADKARTVQAKTEEIKGELGMSPALAQSQATMTPPAGQDIAPAN
jgi:predicted  nucleic acid-binding Zn-ribbon protein